MPTWKSVRELNDTECSAIENRYIYIYGYIRLSLLEKREKHFSSGGRFLSGSGIFRIYIGKLFRSRERERETILFFFARLNSKKEKSFSRPHSVKSY